MRKVIVSEEKWCNEHKRLERVDLYEALFHQFGTDECGENVAATVAIVERIDNGQVEVVFPGNIRFVDREESSVPAVGKTHSPLSELMISDIVYRLGLHPSVKVLSLSLIQFARAIEAAHGIGE
ncbi:MAG: hypothetical protein KDJ31_02955 [Candidatus Competibacteraceae bacterium]|nr:hypothetical protein [Candidatus Competibacteraceae bacterium]